jgi:crotonobetainyl-CoA:carnitine CoA-transferase CaiB-like acyl-CoA transferase
MAGSVPRRRYLVRPGLRLCRRRRGPQIKHNGTFVEYDHPTEGHVKTPGFPIRFSKTPSTVERGAPLVGEHTREILAEAGHDAAQIDALIASGVVRSA